MTISAESRRIILEACKQRKLKRAIEGQEVAEKPVKKNFRWNIINGYLPFWSWRSLSFEWHPSEALLKEWIDKGEIG